MKRFLCLILLLASGQLLAAEETLVCYDELGRKSTILTFDLASGRVTAEQSGDEFACGPGFEKYCTTSTGTVEESPSLIRFSWVRALSGELTVFEVNPDDLTYFGEYAGAVWEGQCEPVAK